MYWSPRLHLASQCLVLWLAGGLSPLLALALDYGLDDSGAHIASHPHLFLFPACVLPIAMVYLFLAVAAALTSHHARVRADCYKILTIAVVFGVAVVGLELLFSTEARWETHLVHDQEHRSIAWMAYLLQCYVSSFVLTILAGFLIWYSRAGEPTPSQDTHEILRATRVGLFILGVWFPLRVLSLILSASSPSVPDVIVLFMYLVGLVGAFRFRRDWTTGGVIAAAGVACTILSALDAEELKRILSSKSSACWTFILSGICVVAIALIGGLNCLSGGETESSPKSGPIKTGIRRRRSQTES